MSFFRTVYQSNCKQVKNKIQKYLRARAFLVHLKFIEKIKSICFGKRMSPSPFPSCRGSMAVEASLAVPLFLFFMMNLLFSFDMIRLQSNLTAALHQTGNQMAFDGYVCKHLSGSPEEAVGWPVAVMSEIYAKGQVVKLLGKDYLDQTCLDGGSAGLSFLKSSVMQEDDVIELVATCRIRPFIRVMGFPDFFMESRYYGRAWTGYDVAGGQGDGERADPLVFVADTGSVYHRERSCTYLNPSVKVVSTAALSEERNENGGKYYACEKCGKDGICAVMFVTAQGTRYHSKLNCSALKRTVYTIRLSDAAGKSACSKCGQ